MWRLSLRDLQWRRRRFVIAILATALVFSVSLLLAGATAALDNEASRIVRFFDADSWLVARNTTGPFDAATMIQASAAKDVAKAPGVKGADPVLVARSTVTTGTDKDVNVVGFPLGGLVKVNIAKGRMMRAPGEVVADTQLGAKPGETVTSGGKRWKVVGTAKKVTFMFGTPTLLMSLPDAQKLVFAGLPLASGIITRGVPTEAPSNLRIMGDKEARGDLQRPMKSGKDTINFINILLWIVAAGIIGSIVYLSALERVRDFAVLKATGASSRSLLLGLALQAIILSVLSAGAAAVLALLLVPGFPFIVEIPLYAYRNLVATAVIVGLLASIAGLRRAVGVDPALAFGGA